MSSLVPSVLKQQCVCELSWRLMEFVRIQEGRRRRDIYSEMLDEPHTCPLTQVGTPEVSLCLHSTVTSLGPFCVLSVSSVSSLCPSCVLSVSSVSSLCPFCILPVSFLCPLCVLSVSSLCPHCVLPVSSLYPPCVLPVSSLCPPCVTVQCRPCSPSVHQCLRAPSVSPV